MMQAKPEAIPSAPAGGKKDQKWDVGARHGPGRDVRIDTTEGTWMNLDGSPGGREIAFDLLGDIYVMPIGGGEARAIATGNAWDMQPRYSPDGREIAFTSDRGGGDNIWVMNRDGSSPRAMTKESFRLLNGPEWTPDGNYIVARKHFTSSRSLGSGEMWLYHRSGVGAGVQMTKARTKQKDSNEPVFSPDGRYLYFSDDATPGDTFQYSKDPNGQIYVIQRLDRNTGEVQPYVTGPGGAVRPTPSPDGKRRAARRLRSARQSVGQGHRRLHATAAPDALRRARGLSGLVARRPADRLRHLGRRPGRLDQGGRRRGRGRPHRHPRTRLLPRTRFLARRADDHLPQGIGRLPCNSFMGPGPRHLCPFPDLRRQAKARLKNRCLAPDPQGRRTS